VASNVVITSGIPQGTAFVSATNDGTEKDGTVIWNIGDLNPGESGSVVYVVSVNDDHADGSTIINDAFGVFSDEASSAGGALVTTMVNAPAGGGGLTIWFVGLFLLVALLAGFGLFFLFYYRSAISGYVLSSANGSPVEGGKVVLSNSAGKVAGETVAKQNGLYSFRLVRRGQYTVAASHPGHQTGEASTASIWVKIFRKIQQDLMLD